MRAMHDKAPGRDRHQVLQTSLDPVLGLDGVEDDALADLLARGITHELADQRLIRRLGKMHRHIPTAVRPLERGDRRFALEEDLGQHSDHAFGGMLSADRKGDAVGSGGEGAIHRCSTAYWAGFSGGYAPDI